MFLTRNRRLRGRVITGLTTALAVLSLAACGGRGSAAESVGVSDDTITIGIVADQTGPLGALNGDGVAAAQARVALQNAEGGVNGRKLVLKVIDTQSASGNVIPGVKELVDREEVFSVISSSCLFGSAVPYLAQKKVPVVSGFPCDGPTWADKTTTNMIDASGSEAVDAPADNLAAVLKEAGVTKLAQVAAGTQRPPLAVQAAIRQAAPRVGIDVVYVDQSQTVPATGLSATAVAIDRSGANGVSVILADYVKVFGALKAQGADTINFSPAGYNPAFLDDPTTAAALEGAVTTFPWAPLVLDNEATGRFSDALTKYAPSMTSPGLGAYTGWVGADATIAGLLAAGDDPTRQGFLDEVHAMKDYTAGGLNAGPVDFSVDKQGTYQKISTGNCSYALVVVGGAYQMLADDPICTDPKE